MDLWSEDAAFSNGLAFQWSLRQRSCQAEGTTWLYKADRNQRMQSSRNKMATHRGSCGLRKHLEASSHTKRALFTHFCMENCSLLGYFLIVILFCFRKLVWLEDLWSNACVIAFENTTLELVKYKWQWHNGKMLLWKRGGQRSDYRRHFPGRLGKSALDDVASVWKTSRANQILHGM